MKDDWTESFYGVLHLGQFSAESSWWATINDYGSFVELLLWFPKCGFSPHQSDHATVAEAKRKGARWVYARS